MSATSVGSALGRVAGKVANTAWNGTVIIATSAGDLGAGFVQGAEDGWDAQELVMQAVIARREANKAKLLALREEQKRLAMAAISATTPVAVMKASKA